MLGYKYPELSMDDEKDPDEKPIKRADHMPDALRYMFMRLPEDPDMLLAPSYDMPDRYIRLPDAKDEEDDEEYEEMSGNYLSYV